MSREVLKKFENIEQKEGDGVKVRRSLGTSQLKSLDPFLMLDEFFLKKPAGFPDHPHRGFETVTYVLSGKTIHEDFCGHKGVLEAGDVQWMTAGRGIVHAEMPGGDDMQWGLQLWINLEKKFKMIEPAYQELKDSEIPKATKDGVSVKVIAGESLGVKSPVYTRTPTMLIDFKLDKGASYVQPIPSDWNAFVFVLGGHGFFGPEGKETESGPHHTLVLNKGESVRFKNDSSPQLHFILIAGKPINEPVAQYGPFVMNTQDEIKQTLDDYQSGKNGFERAPEWRSQSGQNRKR